MEPPTFARPDPARPASVMKVERGDREGPTVPDPIRLAL
jgi:hypothetical protein